MIAEDSAKRQAKRLFCNSCRRDTNHILRGMHTCQDSVDDEGTWESNTYRMWTCAGCDVAVLETAWTASYAWDGETQLETYSYDPPRAVNFLKPKVFRKIPRKMRPIYQQAIKAYNLNLLLLCAAGLRATIEGICADKGLRGKNLEAKINALEGLLPKTIVANLHGLRFMGNEAPHELNAPKPVDIKIAIEVIEDLLNMLYELDYKAGLLPKKAVPPTKSGA